MLEFGDDLFDSQIQHLVDDWKLIQSDKELKRYSTTYGYRAASLKWDQEYDALLKAATPDRVIISLQIREMLWKVAPGLHHVTDRTAGWVGRLFTETYGEC